MNLLELSECFNDLISAPGCRKPGGFINVLNLPGVSLNSLESIRDEDVNSYVELVNILISRSVERVVNDLFLYFDVTLKGEDGVLCRGRLKTDREGRLISGITNSGSFTLGIVQSRFLVLNIFNLRFYSPKQQEITFKIRELGTGSVIAEYPTKVSAGENIIRINKHFNPTAYNRVFEIYYEGDGIEYYETINEPCYSECACKEYILCCDGEGNAPMFGMGVEYSGECSLELFACQNASKFKGVISYAFQMEYFLELIGSNRLNRFTTTKAVDYNFLYEEAKKMYENSYQRLKKSLYLCDECCFKCNSGFIGMRYVRN